MSNISVNGHRVRCIIGQRQPKTNTSISAAQRLRSLRSCLSLVLARFRATANAEQTFPSTARAKAEIASSAVAISHKQIIPVSVASGQEQTSAHNKSRLTLARGQHKKRITLSTPPKSREVMTYVLRAFTQHIYLSRKEILYLSWDVKFYECRRTHTQWRPSLRMQCPFYPLNRFHSNEWRRRRHRSTHTHRWQCHLNCISFGLTPHKLMWPREECGPKIGANICVQRARHTHGLPATHDRRSVYANLESFSNEINIARNIVIISIT